MQERVAEERKKMRNETRGEEKKIYKTGVEEDI